MPGAHKSGVAISGPELRAEILDITLFLNYNLLWGSKLFRIGLYYF